MLLYPEMKKRLILIVPEKSIQNKKINNDFPVVIQQILQQEQLMLLLIPMMDVQNSKEIKSKNTNLNETSGNDFLPDEKSTQKLNDESAENLKNDNEENISDVKKADDLKESINANDTSVASKTSNKKTITIQKKKGLYVGVITGLDFSKVESTSFDNSGFDAGLLLGFRINRALSFETGIAWNNKNYLSDGKSFNIEWRSFYYAPGDGN